MKLLLLRFESIRFLLIMYSVVHLPSLVIFGAIEMTVIITVSLDVH